MICEALAIATPCVATITIIITLLYVTNMVGSNFIWKQIWEST